MAMTSEKPKEEEKPKPAPAEKASAPAAPVPGPAPTEKWLRPFQKLQAFAEGTISEALNGLSTFGRIGSMLGLVGGITLAIIGVAGFTPTLLAYAFGGWAIGLMGGAVIGATVGAATGGAKHVALAERREKYADEITDSHNAHARQNLNQGSRYARAAWSRDVENQQISTVDRFQAYVDRTEDSWANRVTESRGNNSLGY
jgi:hypothetical protein